jgi:Rps23 Pro-64 3,4-dihydroxylase Tpa1-like proline 4-hydroxylase
MRIIQYKNKNLRKNIQEKVSMIRSIQIDSKKYQTMFPFPYGVQDHILEEEMAKKIQEEILNVSEDAWDRYDNPFESKYTLRNKYQFPPLLRELFQELESPNMLNQLSNIVGIPLELDPTRNFWGVHKYKSGDKLDIHVDAGIHPITKQKKQVTLGIYLSQHWKEEYGCELEIWKGSSSESNHASITEMVTSISPLFNRMVLFTCTDNSWHGNPSPVHGSEDATRIFITISYLSNNQEDKNKRSKAFFIARPNDPKDNQKDQLRLLRADPLRYHEIYRT